MSRLPATPSIFTAIAKSYGYLVFTVAHTLIAISDRNVIATRVLTFELQNPEQPIYIVGVIESIEKANNEVLFSVQIRSS